MITGPRSREEFEWCRQVLRQRGNIEVNDNAHILVWLRDGAPAWVVALDCWVGFTCQIQFASLQRYPPRTMIWAVFNYAFNIINRKRIYGLVNSKNERALRLDRWFGFKEVYRMTECAEDGGDIVVMEMKAEDWREKHGRKELPTYA